jgi:hypothetical protein
MLPGFGWLDKQVVVMKAQERKEEKGRAKT